MPTIKRVGGENSKFYEFELSPLEKARLIATSNSLFQKGIEAEIAKKTEEALKFYHQAAALAPKSAAIFCNIGSIEFDRRNLVDAEKFYLHAIEVDRSYHLAYFNLANCLWSKLPAERSKAIKYFLMALELKPQYSDAHYNLAMVYEEVGERRKAIKHFRLYLRFCGKDSALYMRSAESEIRRLVFLERQQITCITSATKQRPH